MRIGIDARMYGSKQGGIGRYIEQLIKHLQHIDHDNQYFLFLRANNLQDCPITNPRFKKILADIPWYSLKEQIYLSRIVKKEKIDLMHFPHWNVPLFYRGKFIVTVHDLIMYHFPRTEASTHGPAIYWLKDKIHRFVIRSATKKAQAIIATSKFTKTDIVTELKINPEKIFVTYQAPFASTNPQNSHPLDNIIKKPYALYVGAGYPHKNLSNLIRAWKKIENRNPEINLLLAGRKNFFYEQLINSAEFKNCSRIQYVSNPDDISLESLYKNAYLFVFPSFYEGFGLPPLEAMQHNIPVVSSNQSCLPEILENSAWYFDPNDTEDIARKILMVFGNQDLRDTLQKNANDLLKKYSWEKLAQETLFLYQKSG